MCPISTYAEGALTTSNMAAVAAPEIGVVPRHVARKENCSPTKEAANVEEDEGCFEPHFDLSDQLNALTALVDNLSLRKEVKQNYPFKKLIIKPKHQMPDEQEELKNQTEISKPRSPSSLKSPNSPTSGLKKSVRFADSMGFDLEHVKLFQSEKIDRYTINDDFFESESKTLLSPTRHVNLFDVTPSWAAASYSSINFNECYLAKRFTLRNIKDVFETTDSQKVCLESLSTTRMFVTGQIQVDNIAYEKKVSLRYTLDGWRTHAEMPCCFLFSNVIDNRDVFCFSLCLPHDLPVGSCCEMCVHYSVAGQNFWDNNNGENYKIDCCSSLPKIPCPDAIEVWTSVQLNSPSFF